MNKKERIKTVTALSLADLLFQYDGETNFNDNHHLYTKLKQQVRDSILKLYKKNSKIWKEGHEHAHSIAKKLEDIKVEYIPVLSGLNVLFDSLDRINKLPKGMRVDTNIIEKLSLAIVESDETNLELLKGCGQMDMTIEEEITNGKTNPR